MAAPCCSAGALLIQPPSGVALLVDAEVYSQGLIKTEMTNTPSNTIPEDKHSNSTTEQITVGQLKLNFYCCNISMSVTS